MTAYRVLITAALGLRKKIGRTQSKIPQEKDRILPVQSKHSSSGSTPGSFHRQTRTDAYTVRNSRIGYWTGSIADS